MTPNRPNTDAGDSNYQVVKNFSPIPGLTHVLDYPKLSTAIIRLHRKHDLPYLNHTGLNLAGSHEWTSIDMEERPHTLLLVIVLNEEDRKRWTEVDGEARQLLRDHELDDMCWVRYYIAVPKPRRTLRISRRRLEELDRDRRRNDEEAPSQISRAVSPPPSLPELDFDRLPQPVPTPRSEVSRLGGWRQTEAAADDIIQAVRERNDSAQVFNDSAPSGRELYEMARDAQNGIQQDLSRERQGPYAPPPRPQHSHRRPSPPQNPWQPSTEEFRRLYRPYPTDRQLRLRSPFWRPSVPSLPPPAAQVPPPQPNDNRQPIPPSPAQMPLPQPNDNQRPTRDLSLLLPEHRTAETLRMLHIGDSEDEDPSALFLAVVAVWLLLAGNNHSMMGSMGGSRFKYESVPGYFRQDDPSTDAATFDYFKHNFGLIDRDYDNEDPSDKGLPQWQRFEKHMMALAKASRESGTQYKVIYLGRHGEGFHNVGEAKYGTEAWDDYWSKLDGDGELYWDDAHLTEKGKGQALMNNAFFKSQFAENGMPASEAYYTSPLYRCLQTANLTYDGLDLPADRPFKPLVKELMREVMGEHTCDRRSTKMVIQQAVPEWRIEHGFTDNDELWRADHRETWDEHDERTKKLLDDVFAHDGHLFVSFTSHSGAIASLLRVIGHVQYKVPTGGMMPVVIKATKET